MNSLFIFIVIFHLYFVIAINDTIFIKERDIDFKRNEKAINNLSCEYCKKNVNNGEKNIKEKQSYNYSKFSIQTNDKINYNRNNKNQLKRDDYYNNNSNNNSSSNNINKINRLNVTCDIIEFGECAIAVDLRSVENQCNDNGKCPETLMNNYLNCVDILFNTGNDIPLLDQPYYQTINKIGLSYSFLCKQAGDEWCYESYKTSLNNVTLQQEFMCSDCGLIVLSQYNLLLEYKEFLNDDQINDIYKYINKQNLCYEENTNISIKIFINIPKFTIISFFLIIFYYI
ncbi:hypothetical protein BCR36DRAFT_347194 [Piromyces finnis]|uniref:Uncharacterized protein n=1 Tax=Piromyces finnis TaxID=1754191 RepID=A0A1Y1VG48_9FUNG|nr:hypothetical protein BCR36DRAFT_347194 [Piromyces finnis]|eukprot:ORX55396.1 hypothetical protein BCR36DRAFT_347194 [Piromyces finnis]